MLLNRIELFVTVAKHQNLGKTAREMHVSASSVCQRLKSLENDFGAKLYTRNKDGIELTGAGRTLLTTATEVLTQLHALRRTLNDDSDGGVVRPLAIGGTYNPSAKYLPSAIAAFQKMHPHIAVRFVTADGPSVTKLVRESDVEIAVIHSPSEASDLHLEHFGADNLTLFAHPAHPLAKKKRLVLEDLSRTPLIVREGTGASHKLLEQLKRQGTKVNVVLRCVSPDAVRAAVRQKMGVGILFYNLIEEDVSRKEVKVLNFSTLPTLIGDSYIAYSKKTPLSDAASDFLTVLRSMKPGLQLPANGGSNGTARL